MDSESLTAAQTEALEQLQALMDGADREVAISVLQSVGWDVQRAAEVVFDQVAPAPAPREVEEFEIDDSEQTGLLRPNPSGRGREFPRVSQSSPLGTLIRPLRAILTVLAFPLRVLATLVRYIFRILHLPIPNFVPFSNLTFSYRPLGPARGADGRPLDAKSAAERWVRALEEETGAVCIGRSARASTDSARSVNGASSGVAGSSSLSSRARSGEGEADSEAKLLPDFFLGSYEQFVRTCEKEVKIGCVVLVSEEHDDVSEFKRSTLTDPTLVRLFQEHDFLVWGADIRDKEGWSASQKLQATTYPFVAFVALQPRRGTASSADPVPTLTILSRHQGAAIPSTSAPTAAHTLVTHLTEHLLPRATPFLGRLRAQAAELAHTRELRAEQDRAFEESARRDRERVEARMAEERAARAEAEAVVRAEEARAAYAARRMAWRRYARRVLLLREPRPGETGRGKTLRVGVRMPDGRRAVRFFGDSDGLASLFAYIDSLFIPPEFVADRDPASPPEGASPGEKGLIEEMKQVGKPAEQWWGFRLWLAYPRKEIVWDLTKHIGEVDALKAGGQVNVEIVGDAPATNGAGKGKQVAHHSAASGDESDGYHTESD